MSKQSEEQKQSRKMMTLERVSNISGIIKEDKHWDWMLFTSRQKDGIVRLTEGKYNNLRELCRANQQKSIFIITSSFSKWTGVSGTVTIAEI